MVAETAANAVVAPAGDPAADVGVATGAGGRVAEEGGWPPPGPAGPPPSQTADGYPLITSGARTVIEAGDPVYPRGLAYVEDRPKALYVVGDAAALSPGIAIVGARKATPYGLACARRFAALAAQMGVTVISGGAIGCDQAAHEGALRAGGTTVVVLGSGADVVYPKRGKALFEEVVGRGGALVSEQPWGYLPRKFAFRKRNRIIAGLASAVLIVEAGLPSGTFSTADYALEAGREVLVVPGAIFSRESAGSNRLLRDGAIPIVDDESLISELGRIFHTNDGYSIEAPGGMKLNLGFDPTPGQVKMLSIIAASPQMPDELHQVMGGTLIEVLKEISLLETKGAIERYPDGRFGLSASIIQ